MDLLKDTYIFSVAELTKRIKGLLEENFSKVYVEGEISNINFPTSGHIYFTLKDKDSQLSAVSFKGSNSKLKFNLEDGLHVICTGRITVYQPRGQYQIVVEHIEPKGEGALQLAFKQLKERLEKEGLFAKEHKKAIPDLPSRIGIVTSSTGKAIRDILNVINRRFSNLEILLIPVKVQGKDAPTQIKEAIETFNIYGKVDVIITGRGGGSLEDLWAFNEEIVARAIYASRIPVISAVGHEPDVTISDLVADLRAPTPSSAAELVISRKEELQDNIDNLFLKLNRAILVCLDILNSDFLRLSDRYFFKHPDNLFIQYQQRIDEIIKSINTNIMYFVQLKDSEFKALVAKMQSLSPLSVLARGWSITTKDESIIRDVSGVRKGDKIKTKLNKGSLISKVEDII